MSFYLPKTGIWSWILTGKKSLWMVITHFPWPVADKMYLREYFHLWLSLPKFSSFPLDIFGQEEMVAREPKIQKEPIPSLLKTPSLVLYFALHCKWYQVQYQIQSPQQNPTLGKAQPLITSQWDVKPPLKVLHRIETCTTAMFSPPKCYRTREMVFAYVSTGKATKINQ